MDGTYKYRAVRNYSGLHAPGVTGSPAKVELNASGNTSLYAPPVGEATTGQTVWNVFNFVVAPNCGVHFVFGQHLVKQRTPGYFQPYCSILLRRALTAITVDDREWGLCQTCTDKSNEPCHVKPGGTEPNVIFSVCKHPLCALPCNTPPPSSCQ